MMTANQHHHHPNNNYQQQAPSTTASSSSMSHSSSLHPTTSSQETTAQQQLQQAFSNMQPFGTNTTITTQQEFDANEIIKQAMEKCNRLFMDMENFEQNLRAWSNNKMNGFQKAVSAQTQMFQNCQNTINNLRVKIEKANEKRQVVEENLKQNYEMVGQLEQQFEERTQYNEELPEVLKNRLAELERYKQAVEQQQEKNRNLKKLYDEHNELLALRLQNSYFQENLGIYFERCERNGVPSLIVSFKIQGMERLGLEQCHFVLSVTDGIYSIQECVPSVSSDDLIETLNQTNQFGRFIVCFRKRFKTYIVSHSNH